MRAWSAIGKDAKAGCMFQPLPTYSPSYLNTRAALEHGKAPSRLCQSVEGGTA